MGIAGRTVTARVAWLCALALCVACDSGPGANALMLDLPERPDDAPNGAEVAEAVRALEVEAREARIYEEIAGGNVPTWLRRLERVELEGDVAGRTRRVTFWVTPDYLSVGSDTDFFSVPLSPGTAKRIAELVGGSLPTRRMVDAVWSAARYRLTPIRLQPDEYIRTVRYFERHDRLVRAQRVLHGVPPGVFVAGHKLDIVLSAVPGEAGLYGWHRGDGRPIQPLVRVPLDDRPHFSLGVRLVHREILVDGARRDLAEVLHDPELAPLLTG